MGNISKQIAIYTSLVLVSASYTMIAPFYPKIASDKGVSLWMVGMIFSTDPLVGLFASMIIGKTMNIIGRKQVILFGLLLTALSMFALCPIEFCDYEIFISLSFLSRIIAGIANGCVLTAAETIFASDYPDQLETMIGRSEGMIGIGLILGPLIGAALYLESLFFALLILGGILLFFVPLASYLLGTFREYKIHTEKISSWGLLLKPVIIIIENYLRYGHEYCIIIFIWIHNSYSWDSFVVFSYFWILYRIMFYPSNCIV